MQDIIKQWPILSLLPMCTTDAGVSIMTCSLCEDIHFINSILSCTWPNRFLSIVFSYDFWLYIYTTQYIEWETLVIWRYTWYTWKQAVNSISSHHILPSDNNSQSLSIPYPFHINVNVNVYLLHPIDSDIEEVASRLYLPFVPA